MRTMTPEQRLQCRRFLAELRRTGNVRLSADRVGIAVQTWRCRRRAHPAFATEWAAALGFARATLATSGPLTPKAPAAKTTGGEYSVRIGRNGEPQVRRAQPGRLSQEGEAMFLRELAATCNISLACDVVGITKSNIYKRRQRSDHFTDRMDAALAQGYERLEFAMMESARYSLGPEEMAAGWLELGVAPPSPLTVMTFDQVINAMGMHMKRVVLGKKRRAHNAHQTTAEETDAAITKLLGMFQKRKAALERYDWGAEETGKRRGPAATPITAAPETKALEHQPTSRANAGAPARVRVVT